MKKYTMQNIVVAIAGAMALNLATTSAAEEAAGMPGSNNNTIVAVASGNPDFSTLVSALSAADLVEALGSAGPFTVFAPNNEAFGKLPPGTVDNLLKPENKEQLAGILKSHVVEGKVMAADVASGTVKTLSGKEIAVVNDDDGVTFGGAKVIAADVPASNGVIHVIDTVVVPD
jgi:uncharacterized surface protein with fasciclin (FAS1) repeats